MLWVGHVKFHEYFNPSIRFSTYHRIMNIWLINGKKAVFSELCCIHALDLAESVNDPSGLETDNNGGKCSLFKVKDIADLWQ